MDTDRGGCVGRAPDGLLRTEPAEVMLYFWPEDATATMEHVVEDGWAEMLRRRPPGRNPMNRPHDHGPNDMSRETASMKPFRDVQPAMAHAAERLNEDVRLEELARKAAMSPYHMHRVFSSVARETPKQLSLRLRMGRAASLLLTRDHSILDVALRCGFQSHEGFTRAFRRTFGTTPSAYRTRGFGVDVTDEEACAYTKLIDEIGRCIGLFRYSPHKRRARYSMAYDITTKEIDPQGVLVERRTVAQSEISATIGDVVGRLFQHAQENGLALAGYPFTRYHEMTPGSMTIEPGMRIVGPIGGGSESGKEGTGGSAAEAHVDPEGDGPRQDVLPGGTVVSTIHAGPYEELGEAYSAIEKWIEANGLKPAGAPWECYLNSPTDHPDPKDWKTEVMWLVG